MQSIVSVTTDIYGNSFKFDTDKEANNPCLTTSIFLDLLETK